MRLLILFLFLISFGLLWLLQKEKAKPFDIPVFLKQDAIVKNSPTSSIIIKTESIIKPNNAQLKILETDYRNIWAHLNYLYQTNDVVAGKEYYTQAWFDYICKNYDGIQQNMISRTDLKHQLYIKNWDRDGLLCTAIDSNIIFQYNYPKHITKSIKTTLAIILLFQGDHWRIDAMRILKEEKL